MKTKHNKILIMMAVILILVAGIVTAGIFLSGRVNAESTAPICEACTNNDNMKITRMTDEEHIYKCTMHPENEKSVKHDFKMISSGNKEQHQVECKICQWAGMVNHTWGSWEKYDNSSHIRSCNLCIAEDKEEHSGVSHSSGGKCTVCKEIVEKHSKSSTILRYKKEINTHTPVYKCTNSGCTSTYTGTAENHTGGTHKDGKCTVCEQVYQTHTMSTTPTSYETTETQHIPVYTCTYVDANGTKCIEPEKGPAANHEGGTHDDGKCTVCEQVYQIHTMSTTVTSYETTETQHIPVYTCTYVDANGTKCTTPEKGTAANHEGGTHDDGKCTVCEEVYQIHTMSTTPTSYETTDTQHTPVYTCTFVDTDGTKCTTPEKGTAENHEVEQWTDNTNGTHSGNCKVCTYKLTEEHNYNNGKCTDCNATEPKQECTHEYISKNNDTQHWEECSKCKQVKTGSMENHTYGKAVDNKDGTHTATCTKCNYKLTENHKYTSGKCSACDAIEPVQECVHSYSTKNNDTQHWEECSKCKQVKTGSKENHTYGEYVDNKNGTHTATCTKCGYKLTENHTYKNENCEDCNAVKPNENCEHKYEQKNNSIQHWEECSKCNQVKTGSAENHTYGKYEDNKDGTHSAICTKCNYKLTEQHTYKDGKCEDCEVAKPSEKCEHTYGEYVDNKDGTHTTTCKKCGEKLTENHSYKDGKCENCGSKKDATIVDKEIPKAGSKNIPVILIGILLSGICIVSVYKMKKYKNI